MTKSKTGLEKMVEWLELYEKAWCGNIRQTVLGKARQLQAEEQAQKPTADKSLVEELKAYLSLDYTVDDTANPHEIDDEWRHDISEILSRYKPTESLADINSLCKRAYETSKAHGFTHDNDGQAIALMHSELSEALEALRKPDKKDEHLPMLDSVGLELADVLIRVFDYCGARGINLQSCLFAKMDYNDKRPIKHGGKKF